MENIWESNEEIALAISRRIQGIRKNRGITQLELSKQSGVSYGSIKRFERFGQISLSSLIQIARALNIANEIKLLFLKELSDGKN